MRFRTYLFWAIALLLLFFIVLRLEGATRPHRAKFDPVSLRPLYPELCGDCAEDETLRPLYQENEFADLNRLHRFTDDDEIAHYAREKLLVRVPVRGVGFFIDPRIKPRSSASLTYAFPIVLDYLKSLSEDFVDVFPGAELKVTSLVRSRGRQQHMATPFIRKGKRLVRNPNWVPGATFCIPERYGHCSVHDTGYAFDLSIRDLSEKRVRWLADRFKEDYGQGLVSVIYEPKLKHFHVMVLPPKGSL